MLNLPRLPPLPTPFILPSYVVGHMLDNLHHGINDFTLLDQTIICNQTFMDNMTLFLEGSNGNLKWAKKVLHHFSLALRAK
jgi:hypothetical protein